ncbi:MAG TPA: helix-turn-helix transcriptional regulator [Pseudonocardiaceae bacterium]
MRDGQATVTGSHGWSSTGLVSGFVLKLARQSTGLTQDQMAERLQVDVSTVRGWESGRRPVAAMNTGEFLRVSTRLRRLGAPASTSRNLREAIEADVVLSTGVGAGPSWVDPDNHPLATSVHRKALTNLITWPMTGQLPPQLAEFRPKTPRRGPSATHPSLTAEERNRFFDHMLTVAERAAHHGEALLRRQAVYLLGFDNRPRTADWLRNEWHRAGRRPAGDGITALLEARSASVALASAGDSSHIHDFVTTMTGTRAEIANLNYWAYWIGELNDEHTDDTFMLTDDTRSWTGIRLLQHLTQRLSPASPHLPLNLHTLHTLVASRPSLLELHNGVSSPLGTALDVLASSDVLSAVGRDQVAGLHYALRIANR